jgi:glycosyltransferase involved in cell wall biosynthesis
MLSIIIPAYNEEKNIRQTLEGLLKNVENINRDFEILLVCDGCKDKTALEAKKIKHKCLKILEYCPNRGKGYALSYGTKHSLGEVVTFLDAGGDFDTTHIDKFIKLMEVFDADIVIGSKRHPASVVEYPLKRRFFSYIYHMMIRILFDLNVKDTQTGLKVFKRQVLVDILPRAVVKKYAFDLELLVISKKLGYKKIFEAPVKMNYNFTNTGINFRSIKDMILDTMAIFYRLNFLKYYDKAHFKIKNEKQ